MVVLIIIIGVIALTILDYFLISTAGVYDDEEQERWIAQWREQHDSKKQSAGKHEDDRRGDCQEFQAGKKQERADQDLGRFKLHKQGRDQRNP